MKTLIAALLLSMSFCVYAQQTQKVNPSSTLKEDAEKGWHFYEDPLEDVKPPRARQPQTPKEMAPPPPKEERCKQKEAWSVDCGFVDPGVDFEFQAKQRDALLENMSMSQNDPKAVEAFQYYVRWMVGRASEVANLWYYNMVQNPDLDPQTSAPISHFGLRLMTEVRNGKANEIFAALREEGALLVYFTRSDCQFCHAMLPTVNSVASKTGIETWNAALDDRCLQGFDGFCKSGKETQGPAAALQVTTVPTLFLYVKPNTWIRLATGVTDESSVLTRTSSFFSAYRNALLKGINNAQPGRAPVDFSGTEPTGLGMGVTPTKSPRTPTEAEIARLLGKND